MAGTIGPWTDVYAFASVIYRVLVGNAPTDAPTRATNDRLVIPAKIAENVPKHSMVALANAEYICYASPHTEVFNNPEYSFYQDEILYPEEGKFKTQLFLNLDPEILELMSTLWDDVKNHIPSSGGKSFFFGGGSDNAADDGEAMTPDAVKYAVYIGIFVLICLAYIIFRYARKKYREKV